MFDGAAKGINNAFSDFRAKPWLSTPGSYTFDAKTGIGTHTPGVTGKYDTLMGFGKDLFGLAGSIQDFRNASLMRKEFKNQMGRAAGLYAMQEKEVARLNQRRDRLAHIQQHGVQGTAEDWAKRGKEMEQWRNVA